MSSVKTNIVANFIGRTWGSLVGILVVPIYIHFIGIEQYGILGVFAIFQTILGLLDMGLSPTLNRELAGNISLPNGKKYVNDLLFSMETIVFSISLVAGIGMVFTSSFFVNHWINLDKLSVHTATMAFILMAINFSIQFPFGIYQGGFMGLQKQITLNTILLCATTIKPIATILFLYLVSPSIITLLIVQIVVNIFQLYFFRAYLWKYIPTIEGKPVFTKEVIRKSGRYAAGIFMISILTILLTQIDKIVLSKLLKLSKYGYYTLATTVAGTLSILLYAITGAIFPKMTEYVSTNQQIELKTVFHKSSQLVSLAVLPVALCIFIFSEDLLLAWTRNSEIARNAGPVLKYLIIGTAINSLMTIPYQYSLSVGWLRYGINISIVAIIIFLPVILFAAYNYGVIGCAFVWMVLNITYFIFAMLYLFSKHLTSERNKWYVTDVGRPMVVAILTTTPFYFVHLYYPLNNIYLLFLFILCMGLTYITTLVWGTPAIKQELQNIIGKKMPNLLKNKFRAGN